LPSGRQGRLDQTQYDIDFRQALPGVPESFARQTLEQIAQNRASGQALGNDQAQAGSTDRANCPALPATPVAQFETAAADSQATGHDDREFVGPVQAVKGTKAKPRLRSPGHRRTTFLDFRSDAEALTALGATCANDGAAATGTHAHQETVCALATHHRRLISPFHGIALSRETRDYSVAARLCQGQFSATPCG
jgi:hypothetical protein